MTELYCTRPGLPGGLPEPLARTLAQTRSLATLDEHVRRVCRASLRARGHEAELLAVMRQLADDGLLVSLDELRSATTPERAPAVQSINVLGCERPRELERCVASAIANLREHGRRLEIAVFDDSRDAAKERLNRELLAVLARREGFEIRHAGRGRRTELASRLARAAGVRPELAAFAIAGAGVCAETIGANRNAMLLERLDSAWLSADDDMVFSGVLPPGAERGVRLAGRRDPTELWFFDSRLSARAAFADAPIDVIGEHERVLGRSLAELLGADAGAVVLEEPSPSLAAEMSEGHARVVLSLTGVIGDSGHHAATALLTHDAGGTRARLLASAESYATAFSSREMLKTVDRVTLGQSAALATTLFGVDGTRFLPPFNPGHRNEDGVFGLMLQLIAPGAYSAAVPAALWHLPPIRRHVPGAHLASAERLRLCDLLIALLLECRLPAQERVPERRLNAIARALLEIAGAEPAEFAAIARAAVARFVDRRVQLLEEALVDEQGPQYWVDDVRAFVERSRAAARSPDHWLPSDVALPAPERAAYAQRHLRRLGELFEAWGPLCRAWRELRDRGERLTECVR